ncbi:MAG: NUDIX domain-containing protein [Planctomycetales bacterium]|nr:NUDIX domain-containing protein [Planctomycetales bacterium]
MKKLKACGVLIVKGDPIESFLLMEHVDRLDLPKGHVDEGETEEECALRELEEETGISADDVELDTGFRFTTTYVVRPKKKLFEPHEKTTVIFLGRLRRDVPIQITEHIGYRWVAWSPPHSIQAATIDPLLAQLDKYLGETA